MHEDIVKKLQWHKNRNNPVAAIVIIVIFFIFCSFISLLIWFPKLAILCMVLCALIIWSIVWNEKRQEKLIDLVKSWKIIIIETTITDFKVSHGDNFKTILWYYIISSDWDKTYKSNLLEHSLLSGDDVDDSNIDEYKRYSVLKAHNGKSFRIWDKISVYLDPNNPKNYYVNW